MSVHPSLADTAYKSPYDASNYYHLAAMNSSTFPVDYTLASPSLTANYGKQIDPFTRNAATYHGGSSSGAILDLSVPTSNTQLDSSWQSDPPELLAATTRFFTKNVAHFQTSTLTMSSEVFENPILETPRVSTAAVKNQDHRRDDIPFRLKALWDSINPVEEPCVSTSAADLYETHNSPKVTPVPVLTTDSELGNRNANVSDVSLKEMIDIDDLDMGDISNILSIPAGNSVKKTKPTIEDEMVCQSSGALPNLSSFLRGIEYL